MRILYLDAYFVINVLANYLLCLSTGRLCSLRLRRGRYWAAALLGGAYAVLALLPALSFLASVWGKAGAALAMGLLAFGAEAKPLRCVLAMLMVCFAFGGLLTALSLCAGGAPKLPLRTLAAAFFLCCGLFKLLSRFRSRWDGEKKALVQLRFAGKETEFSALVDSGNSLRDPGTGEGVLVASPRALRPVFAEYTTLLEELQPAELLEVMAGIPAFSGKLRLLPFRSLGGAGLLPVFRPEGLWIDGRKTDDLLVAISGQILGNGYEAIL